ncbi:hypothetical protein G5I_04310 [Acromyrmex echinatior]|uniref:Uncharacterized protein n=1 Tax=Acromyrmex echinatior TaxID=103372 RepID=F4WFA3_ACREC|nr:hypothetical protein G5I_04310 [Acromyrmex echinatior]
MEITVVIDIFALNQETRSLRRLFATGFRFATELFAKTFCGTTSRREQRGRNSGNLPECPAGNRKMNFMIDADDAHPTHSSFPNGRYRGYTFAFFLIPFLSLSLIGNSTMEEIAREKFQRVSRDAPRAEDVVGDLRSYKSSASAEQRSSGRDCSPIKCIRTVSGVGIRVGRRQRKWLLKFRDNRGKFYSLFVLEDRKKKKERAIHGFSVDPFADDCIDGNSRLVYREMYLGTSPLMRSRISMEI